MRLHRLRLADFRSHAHTEVTFHDKLNVIWGANGAGKTNLLEGIHYLGLTKSFLVSKDRYVLQKGKAHFEVEGHFTGVHRPRMQVKVVYVPNEGKRVFVNKAPLDRLTEVVGMVPIVVASPTDIAITGGGPEERRRFVDNTLSQAHPVYLDDLMRYRRALKQRNALLTDLRRRRPVDPGMLVSWDHELASAGSRIVVARRTFIRTFCDYVLEAYGQLQAVQEEPKLTYKPAVRLPKNTEDADVRAAFESHLREAAGNERARGRTLVGPHRDEIMLELDGLEVRRYASQGQHRTFGLALMLAKYYYLQEQRGEPPLFLLDDVFGDLDERRKAVILSLLQSDRVGQCFVSVADPAVLEEGLGEGGAYARIQVANGGVQAETTEAG